MFCSCFGRLHSLVLSLIASATITRRLRPSLLRSPPSASVLSLPESSVLQAGSQLLPFSQEPVLQPIAGVLNHSHMSPTDLTLLPAEALLGHEQQQGPASQCFSNFVATKIGVFLSACFLCAYCVSCYFTKSSVCNCFSIAYVFPKYMHYCIICT